MMCRLLGGFHGWLLYDIYTVLNDTRRHLAEPHLVGETPAIDFSHAMKLA